ncbi:N-acetylmuramic acid 6-phosphate etherase [Wohlfahrtiimonas larvae]|uniref:N-acetylmuramic acid 6-phosphate etherase n=1 Tax=Wohlfahrtiimonas larvae TaxID=1157986 RepID=A0ABP9ML86_9GAMM|nr:N-acetylmuramic acid 6-phosphate etherase [Wohlfahrtiimonas larvae]
MAHNNVKNLLTEQRNNLSTNIDQMSILEMVQLMNHEDQNIINAIANVTKSIASAVDMIAEVIQKGGRLVYIGAGTSGRLGVLDASECLPTFGVGEETVIGIIAGGDQALRNPVENAEDNREAVITDLQNINFNHKDILCAIAASGRTPYCVSGLEYAKQLGAKTIALACTEYNPMFEISDTNIPILVGAEVITGSTRLKAGSAQKMVLNMLTTCSMIKIGKTYGNLMVDVKPTNEKLHHRAVNMLATILDIDDETAEDLLKSAHNHVKTAILMYLKSVNYDQAIELLANNQSRLSEALKD